MRQRRPAQRIRWLSVTQGRNQISCTPQACGCGTKCEPKRSPKLGGSHHEQPPTFRPALGRRSRFPGPRADHLVHRSEPAPAATPPPRRSTDANATGKAPLAPPSREGFWGRINPFARKNYVQRQTEPIRDRVNELDELTSQNGKNIKDTDARAQAGIKLASDKATVADQHAVDAGNKATAAQQTAQQVTTRVQTVETVVSNIDQYKAENQTEIRFRPGQTVLSKNAKDALDTMATSVKGQRGYIIEVQGFSSGKGQAAITNSQKMAESVVRYLVLNHEIPVYRIYLVGMGNAPATDG